MPVAIGAHGKAETGNLLCRATSPGPGMPHGLHPGDEPVVLTPAEQVGQMVRGLNRERGRENILPLKHSQAMQCSRPRVPKLAAIERLNENPARSATDP
jgi:hypothetical protein